MYMGRGFLFSVNLAIAGYSLSAVAKIPIIFAVSWAWVLFGRVADRFGKGVRTAPRDAIIADAAVEGQRGRAFGLHRAMDTLGAVIGVALAYLFFTSYHGDYRTVFFWSLVPAIIGVGILFGVREKEPKGLPKKVLSLKWSSLLLGKVACFTDEEPTDLRINIFGERKNEFGKN